MINKLDCLYLVIFTGLQAQQTFNETSLSRKASAFVVLEHF
jgi:hypothetical protein